MLPSAKREALRQFVNMAQLELITQHWSREETPLPILIFGDMGIDYITSPISIMATSDFGG